VDCGLRTADCGTPATGRPREVTGRAGGESGYTLVIVVLAIAIMSILMGVAVQTVEFQMRREREAELIFRGEQYVEAIRLFRMKYGRYPMRLQEIWEANPRVVRKAWKDPITDSDDWGLIFLGQGGRRIGPQNPLGQTPQATQTVTYQGDRPSEDDTSPFATGDKDGEKIGPIVGVHSKSCDESIKVYQGRTTYCEWQFVFREEGSTRLGGGAPPGGYRPGGPPVPPGGGGAGDTGGEKPPYGYPTPGQTPTILP